MVPCGPRLQDSSDAMLWLFTFILSFWGDFCDFEIQVEGIGSWLDFGRLWPFLSSHGIWTRSCRSDDKSAKMGLFDG